MSLLWGDPKDENLLQMTDDAVTNDHDHDHEAEIRNCITQKAGRETLPMLSSRIHHEKQPKCQTYSSVKVSHHGTYGCSCPQVSEKFATLSFLKKDERGKRKEKAKTPSKKVNATLLFNAATRRPSKQFVNF